MICLRMWSITSRLVASSRQQKRTHARGKGPWTEKERRAHAREAICSHGQRSAAVGRCGRLVASLPIVVHELTHLGELELLPAVVVGWHETEQAPHYVAAQVRETEGLAEGDGRDGHF